MIEINEIAFAFFWLVTVAIVIALLVIGFWLERIFKLMWEVMKEEEPEEPSEDPFKQGEDKE